MGFIHEHIILPLSDLVKGERVHHYLHELHKAESWSEEQMTAFQQERLRKLIIYASKEVPYYRDWFRDNNIDPTAVTLDQMPIVNKAVMRQEGIDQFTAEHFPKQKRRESRSSGSTGEPFSYYSTKLADSVNTASKLRTWYQAGYRLGDCYMKIANGARHGRIKKLQDTVNNCIYVPFYSLDDDALRSILDTIENQQPHFIRAYPIPLHLLAQYRNRHTEEYHHKPLHVMTTGSTLPQAYREEIERAFGCDIIDSYSCEGTPNTYETVVHDGYTITKYYGIIEVLDNEGKPIDNGIGRVISTDLWNFAHPFIRYDTQDLVEVSNGQIMRIMGRQTEVLVRGKEEIYTAHNFSHFFTHEVSGITAYQIIKHQKGDITFRLVVTNQYSTDIEQHIKEHWQQLLGVTIDIAIVDEIPLMHNNKRLTIIEE